MTRERVVREGKERRVEGRGSEESVERKGLGRGKEEKGASRREVKKVERGELAGEVSGHRVGNEIDR